MSAGGAGIAVVRLTGHGASLYLPPAGPWTLYWLEVDSCPASALAIRLSQQGAITAVSQNANHPTSNEAANCLLFRAVWPAADGEFIVGDSMFIYSIIYATRISHAP